MAVTCARLDYSKPPPDFDVRVLDKSLHGTVLTAGVLGPRALAAAWAHYKARHDPPGLETRLWCGGWLFCALVDSDGQPYTVRGPGYGSTSTAATQVEARAAAWAWHDQRLALERALELLVKQRLEQSRAALAGLRDLQPADETAVRLDMESQTQPYVNMFALWPNILVWSDEQVAEVERWLAAEMPEVLHGRE